MELKEIQTAFKAEANKLGEYQLLTKTELANGYCDAEESNNEEKRSQYWAALMLRYWYKIYEWQENSSSLHLEPDEFVGWLNEALETAFYYKQWRYEFKAEVKKGKFIDWKVDSKGNKIENPYYYVKDVDAVDKIINRCIGSERGKQYQYNNKIKRKSNVLVYSIEKQVEDNGDGFLNEVGCTTSEIQYDGTKDVIKKLLTKNQIIEALVVDGIVNGDSFKEFINKETEEVSSVFDMRKLVKHLTNINQEFIQSYFCPNYNIENIKSVEIFDKLKSLDNKKLYRYINKTLIQIKENSSLLSCIRV